MELCVVNPIKTEILYITANAAVKVIIALKKAGSQ